MKKLLVALIAFLPLSGYSYGEKITCTPQVQDICKFDFRESKTSCEWAQPDQDYFMSLIEIEVSEKRLAVTEWHSGEYQAYNREIIHIEESHDDNMNLSGLSVIFKSYNMLSYMVVTGSQFTIMHNILNFPSEPDHETLSHRVVTGTCE